MGRAKAIVQHQGDTQEPQQQATVMGPLHNKINLISCEPMAHVSDMGLYQKVVRTISLAP